MIEKSGFVLEYNYACLVLFWISLSLLLVFFFFFFKLGFYVYFEDLHWSASKTGEKQREKHG